MDTEGETITTLLLQGVNELHTQDQLRRIKDIKSGYITLWTPADYYLARYYKELKYYKRKNIEEIRKLLSISYSKWKELYSPRYRDIKEDDPNLVARSLYNWLGGKPNIEDITEDETAMYYPGYMENIGEK